MKLPDSLSFYSGPSLADDSQSNWSCGKFLGDVFTLIGEPTYIVDIDRFIANWVHQCHERPGLRLPPGDAADKKAVVKWAWRVLNDPNRSCDSASVDYRVGLIRYLEKLMRTEFVSTKDLRQHVERYFDGHDGRRLPISEAIKRTRKKLKLTQKQMAAQLGLKDHTLISKYEKGERVPSDNVLNWLKENENVTAKGQVKGNSRTPRFSVTSSRGKGASISLNFGKSETSPKQQKCTNADDTIQTAPESATPRAETNPIASAKNVDHV